MNESVRKFREGFIENDEAESQQLSPIAKAKAAPPPPPPPEEPDDVEAEAPAETWPLRVKLQKPIRISGGDMVNELSFREPTGRDINRHGNPTRMGPDLMFVIDEKKMMSMMASLSGVMTPDLERMDARDWNTCAWRLYRFFLPTTILD